MKRFAATGALSFVLGGAVAALLLAIHPAIAGTPRLQIYFASDFTDVAYQQRVYRKVAAAWKWPPQAPKPGDKAVVIATIRKDGAAPGPMLHMKSGSDAWDAAALAAVRSAAPFDPLPKSYPHPSVEVHFHFEFGE